MKLSTALPIPKSSAMPESLLKAKAASSALRNGG
nr:MAG TPA: hypothetical protein [Caudoviricetes sp.]